MPTIKKSLLLIFVFACSVMLMSAGWLTDFSLAKKEARNTNKYMLLCFSGSDWCIPCIRAKKEIFDKEAFRQYADSNLVLVNADFPRLKKNRLNMQQIRENEALALQYDKEGAFPYTLLLDSTGKVLKEWKGYPGISPEAFISQIKAVSNPR
jgi:thioredoxin-related protein